MSSALDALLFGIRRVFFGGSELPSSDSLEFAGNVSVANVGGRTRVTVASGGAGTGDVVGPSSAVSGRIPVFANTSGKLISDGGASIAEVRARANHTGEQAISTITGLAAALAALDSISFSRVQSALAAATADVGLNQKSLINLGGADLAMRTIPFSSAMTLPTDTHSLHSTSDYLTSDFSLHLDNTASGRSGYIVLMQDAVGGRRLTSMTYSSIYGIGSTVVSAGAELDSEDVPIVNPVPNSQTILHYRVWDNGVIVWSSYASPRLPVVKNLAFASVLPLDFSRCDQLRTTATGNITVPSVSGLVSHKWHEWVVHVPVNAIYALTVPGTLNFRYEPSANQTQINRGTNIFRFRSDPAGGVLFQRDVYGNPFSLE